jgi:hypothetical protein
MILSRQSCHVIDLTIDDMENEGDAAGKRRQLIFVSLATVLLKFRNL